MKIIGSYGDNMVGVQHAQGAIEQADDYKMIIVVAGKW
jgi:hypothetical protein